MSGRRDSNSRHSAWKADALPTELLPLAHRNGKRVGVIGFEPIQSKTTDLQSAPALQLRRTPLVLYFLVDDGAGGGIRTPDLLITNQLL